MRPNIDQNIYQGTRFLPCNERYWKSVALFKFNQRCKTHYSKLPLSNWWRWGIYLNFGLDWKGKICIHVW